MNRDGITVTTLQDELIEFYRQLSLLAKANLPLPQSLQSLAQDCQSRKLAPVIAALADDVGKGITLSDALAARRNVFSPLHVHIISAGERGGVLMESLREVAEIARFERRQAQQLREAATYPVFTVVVATGVLLAVVRFIVPGMADVLSEMIGADYLPPLTRLLFWLSAVVSHVWPLALTAYAVGVALLAWIVIGGTSSERILLGLLPMLPGTKSVVRLLDTARASGLCAVLLARETPADRALRLVADTTRNSKLAATFARIGERCASGHPLATCVDAERALPESLKIVFSTTDESDIPVQLHALQELYVEQAEILVRRLSVFWEVGVIAGTTCFVGLIITSLFAPLITLVRALGG